MGGDSMLRRRRWLLLRLPLIFVLASLQVLLDLCPYELNRKWDDEYGLNVVRRNLSEVLYLVKKAWG